MLVSAAVVESVLDPEAVSRLVADDSAGAICVFVGRVRDHDPAASGPVAGIEYLAHPEAEEKLRAAVSAVDRQPESCRVAIAHRIGWLEVGQVVMVVAVASAHRELAFSMCSQIVDEVKATVPIWKKQVAVAGGAHWIGLPRDE